MDSKHISDYSNCTARVLLNDEIDVDKEISGKAERHVQR